MLVLIAWGGITGAGGMAIVLAGAGCAGVVAIAEGPAALANACTICSGRGGVPDVSGGGDSVSVGWLGSAGLEVETADGAGGSDGG